MRWIPPGEFTMGTDDSQSFPNERPAHRVRFKPGVFRDAVIHERHEQRMTERRKRVAHAKTVGKRLSPRLPFDRQTHALSRREIDDVTVVQKKAVRKQAHPLLANGECKTITARKRLKSLENAKLRLRDRAETSYTLSRRCCVFSPRENRTAERSS